MTTKLWGGVLAGVFITAVGVEIVRRKCPGFTKKVSERTKKITGSAGEKIKDFTTSARDAFRNGYASVKTGVSKA
ncbi:unnamed protein product [marine sediment metagenome]|uniref:YtxH domain-containing protein n=1 Tax=marine sediment metagenome TaxID=412755 RepID=X1U3I2_9ZZZZ